LVFTSDLRTTASIDQVSTYSKMHTFDIDGERQFVLLSAGKLATMQAVIAHVQRDIADNTKVNFPTVAYLSEAAEYLGKISRRLIAKYSESSPQNTFNPDATFILGGQIADRSYAIYLIYPQGNYIFASAAAPFFLLGENKYGMNNYWCN
jgi:putative proteasome-type protease